MKNWLLLLIITTVIFSCKKNNTTQQEELVSYTSDAPPFGYKVLGSEGNIAKNVIEGRYLQTKVTVKIAEWTRRRSSNVTEAYFYQNWQSHNGSPYTPIQEGNPQGNQFVEHNTYASTIGASVVLSTNLNWDEDRRAYTQYFQVIIAENGRDFFPRVSLSANIDSVASEVMSNINIFGASYLRRGKLYYRHNPTDKANPIKLTVKMPDAIKYGKGAEIRMTATIKNTTSNNKPIDVPLKKRH